MNGIERWKSLDMTWNQTPINHQKKEDVRHETIHTGKPGIPSAP